MSVLHCGVDFGTTNSTVGLCAAGGAPYLIPVTLRAMAEVRGVAEEALAEHVAANTARAFGYPPRT